MNTSIPVRFPQEIEQRLKRVSENTGIPVAHLVRIATEQYLQTVENAGAVTLPLELKEKPIKTGKTRNPRL